MRTMRMPYRQYKQHYSDCKTVSGSYDKNTKTIEIFVPEGRMKPSGVRGQRFSGYKLKIKYRGKIYGVSFRAVSMENAIRQAERNFGVGCVIDTLNVFM